MESLIYQNLRKLINVIDDLRDVGLQQYVNLPRICVVGTQSAGKSSVLENIVGLDFLPRGDGVCTRRPLELRLVHLSEKTYKPEDSYAVFGDGPTAGKQRFSDFNLVKKEIERLTDEVAGANKGIVDSPIILTIFSPVCPDLTLIDLPGITRVPLSGSDQKEDIEAITKAMSLKYVQDPRTIILAVIPANVDITASDALALARSVDPQGLRTIGVITKIDLMDRGVNAVREDYRLKLGYVGVRNRSQADIQANKGVKAAIEEEREWFAEHPDYKALPPQFLGTQSLVEKLTKVLFSHIKNFLPEIKSEIASRKRQVETRLEELGQGVPSDEQERAQVIWAMCNDFCEVLSNTIRGKYDKKMQTYFDNELPGGSQIRTVFSELLLDQAGNPSTRDVSDAEIERAVRIHEGDALPGFPSPDTFEYLMLPHLRLLQEPVNDCLERIAAVLENLCNRIASRVLVRFPALSSKVCEISQSIIITNREATRGILASLVEAEMGYLFTNDQGYISHHASLVNVAGEQTQVSKQVEYQRQLKQWEEQCAAIRAQHELKRQKEGNTLTNFMNSGPELPPQPQPPATLTPQQSFVLEIRRRLDTYFSLVINQVRDTVPKVIGHFLVRNIQKSLQFDLYTALSDPSTLDALLGEPTFVTEERKQLVQQVKTLSNAQLVLQRDPSIAAALLPSADQAPAFVSAPRSNPILSTTGPSASPVVQSSVVHQRQPSIPQMSPATPASKPVQTAAPAISAGLAAPAIPRNGAASAASTATAASAAASLAAQTAQKASTMAGLASKMGMFGSGNPLFE